ncbi:MAG: hypothetical protein ACRENG_05710 [bacterium]
MKQPRVHPASAGFVRQVIYDVIPEESLACGTAWRGARARFFDSSNLA